MSTAIENMETFPTSSSTSSLTLYGLIFATILFLIYYWRQNKRYFELGNAIPGPPALPLIGNVLEAVEALMSSPEQIMLRGLEYCETYGKIVRAWLGPQLLVFILNPADAESILSSQVHINKSDEYQLFKPWLGDGLLISSGEKWRTHRKLIAPTFHMNVLKSFVDVFNKNSRMVVKSMRKEIGRTFDVHDYMSGITVDILLETAMGVKRSHPDSVGLEYALAVMKMCDILHQRHYKFWIRPEIIFKFTSFAKRQIQYLDIIHSLTNKVIKMKKEEYIRNRSEGKPSYFQQIETQAEHQDKKEAKIVTTNNNTLNPKQGSFLRDDLDEIDENDVGEKKRLAFLDLLIETSQTTGILTDIDIKEEVDTIMFEGHDTTAAGSSFVLCLLGVHQDIQRKVYQELHDIFGDSDRSVTYLDTLEMKYLERVILETLRLYPPVPLIARKLYEDLKVASGYTLPAGATVLIGTYKIHRDPDNYKNPEAFDPDNFLAERTQQRHYYSFIPFSAGPRSCVGRKYAMLKLKILLATILRNYRIISDVTEKEFRLRADIILKRGDGFQIRFEPRK